MYIITGEANSYGKRLYRVACLLPVMKVEEMQSQEGTDMQWQPLGSPFDHKGCLCQVVLCLQFTNIPLDTTKYTPEAFK